MPIDEPDPLLTTADVARLLCTPEATVRYWVSLGTGPLSFKIGRRLYRKSDVLAWVEARRAATLRGESA